MGNHFWCRLLNHIQFFHSLLNPLIPSGLQSHSRIAQGNMQVAGSRPHSVIRVTGAVCCVLIAFLPAALELAITGKQAQRAMKTKWKKKKKAEPKRWLSKKFGDKPFAQSTECCFMIMKGGWLNSEGKPHVRWKRFKGFFLPSHRAVKQDSSGISGQYCPVGTTRLTPQRAPGRPCCPKAWVLCNQSE